MNYIKKNFNKTFELFKIFKNKNLYILSFYFFAITLFSSFGMYFANNINVNHQFINVLKAFSMYFFTIVLPLGGIIYYHKIEENNKYIKNLKYSILPLFKLKTILYFLFSLFFISLVLMLFFKFNKELVEFIEISKELITSKKISEFNSILPFLEENNKEKYDLFISFFNSYKLYISIILFIFSFAFIFSVFFLSLIDFYINDSNFFYSLKKSLKINIKYIIYISLSLLLFLFINNLSSNLNSDNFIFLLFLLLIKSFSSSFLVISYYLLLIKDINKDKNDPYDTQKI